VAFIGKKQTKSYPTYKQSPDSEKDGREAPTNRAERKKKPVRCALNLKIPKVVSSFDTGRLYP